MRFSYTPLENGADLVPPTMSTVSEDDETFCGNKAETEIPQSNDQINVLCELVGATDLSMVDDDLLPDSSSWNDDLIQPYYIVKFGGHIVHKSKTAEEKGVNPIWTVNTKSVFALSVTPEELLHNSKLHFTILTKRQDTLQIVNKVGKAFNMQDSIFLGQVQLDTFQILSQFCTEDRLEFPLLNALQENDGLRGSIALRFRIATSSDLDFNKYWNTKKLIKSERILESKRLLLREEACNNFEPNKNRDNDNTDDLPPGENNRSTKSKSIRKLAELVSEQNETELVGDTIMNALSFAFRTRSVLDGETGLTKVRIKPHPDAARKNYTSFMTQADIKMETLKPSLESSWTEAGSGKLGRLFLEVLSCHDLPNLDVGEAVGNVTDSFVAAVFEDALVQTPIIDDELSPHWLPWTNRAFAFNIMHPTSILYLAVFDYDFGPSGNEPIGRVAVNIKNFKRDTVYTLRYNLYPSSNVTERNAQGSITIRLRVEINDEKAALIASLKPRPIMHINVTKEKSFRIARYTCYGEYDNEENFDLTVFRSYINEIFEAKALVAYKIVDAFQSLIFWRGQVRVFGVMLPIHSFFFFCAGSTIVERPHMIPAFMFLSVPWILFATMRIRLQHPSPWDTCYSFWDYLHILKEGKSPGRGIRIDAMEGWDNAQAFERAWELRLKKDEQTAERRAEMEKELNEIGDDNIRTKVNGGAVIPLELIDRLTRYQGIIGRMCLKIRAVKSVLIWEESILSFWISAVFLTAGVISLFLPWKLILTWTGRAVVHGLFGPHMKFVDLVIRTKFKNKSVMRNFDHLKGLARIKREEALKLKAIKCLRFGKLITQVPEYNLSRHYDRPLPQSTARPWKGNLLAPKLDAAQWLPRQQLYGPMIPRGENESLMNKELSFKERERLVNSLEVRLNALRAAENCGERVSPMPPESDDESQNEMGYELIPYVNAVMGKTLESRPAYNPALASVVMELQMKKQDSHDDSGINIFSCGMEDSDVEPSECTTSLVRIDEATEDETEDTASMREMDFEDETQATTISSKDSMEEDGVHDTDASQATSTNKDFGRYATDEANSTSSNSSRDSMKDDVENDVDASQAISTNKEVGMNATDEANITELEAAMTGADHCDEEGLEIIAFEPITRDEVGELSAIFYESPNTSIAYYRT